MSYILLFLFVFTAYGAQKREDVEMGPVKRITLEQMDAESYKVLRGKVVELKGQKKILTTQTLFHDPQTAQKEWRNVVHLSETTEYSLLLCTLREASKSPQKDTCICTTLESCAALSSVLAELNLKAHVGLKAGCIEDKSPQFKNDFSHILEEAKDKKEFVFVSITSQSALPAGEFVVQLKRSGALKERKKLIFCAGTKSYCADYLIGDIHYGKTHARVQDHGTFLQQLATRAVQAERLASKRLCDKRFLESAEFTKQYDLWIQALTEHDLQTYWGAQFTDGTICSTQNPSNVLALNNPDQGLEFLTKRLGTRKPNGERTIKADILLGTPTSPLLNLLEKSCIFGCSAKLFLGLQAKGADVRYVYDSDVYYGSCPKHIPNTQNRILLCAGPQQFHEIIKKWAKFSAAKMQHRAQLFFVPCDSLSPSAPYIISTSKTTTLLECPLRPTHIHPSEPAQDKDA